MVDLESPGALFGEAIRWYRKGRGYPAGQDAVTQEELAKATGVPKGTIAYIESGRSAQPRAEATAPLAKYFGFPNAEKMVEGYLTRRVRDNQDDAAVNRLIQTVGRLDKRVARLEEKVGFSDSASGVVQQRRDPAERLRLPAYESGAAAARRLLDVENFGEAADGELPVPEGFEDEIGVDGFALRVRGDSLSGLRRPILDGDYVWIDPTSETRRQGKVHVAVVRESHDGEPKVVVKLLRGDKLYSVVRDASGDGVEMELPMYEVVTMTPVVAVTRSAAP